MKKRILVSLVMVMSLLVWGWGTGYAKVTGRCDNCHTMHNSQNGADLYTSESEHLLIGGCVACHSHASEITYDIGTGDSKSTVPVVYTTGNAPITYLAGGNFYWVATACTGINCGDAKGHNVLGISTQDGEISAAEGAPGDSNGCADSCHTTLAVAPSSVNNGGCEGCHLNVMHHADDGTGTKYVGASPWYRFLSAHETGAGYGVEGIEHIGWGPNDCAVGGTDHNEYKGKSGEGSGTFAAGDGTMTAFCSGCHRNFHSDQDTGTAGEWTRHPSDFTIPNSGEYASITSYDPLSPVARTDAAMTTLGDNPSAIVAAGSDMVMCLSCHRPHGSPYDDLLRWDYAGMIAGSSDNANTGCFYCHSTKDDG